MSVAILNEWVVKVKPSPTIDLYLQVNALKEKGIKVHDFGIGELVPEINLPQIIKDEIIYAVNNDETGYVNSRGDHELLCALSEDFKNFKLNYSPSQFVICAGPKDAIFKAAMTVLNPLAKQNQTVVFSPVYESFENVPFLLTGKQPIVLDTDENFYPNVSELRELLDKDNTIVLIILNSPNNPTGAVYPPKLLEELAEVISQHPRVTVLFDEVYRTMTYGAKFTNIAEYLPNQTLVVGGMSKEVAGTGLRIGYVAGPEGIINHIVNAQGNASACVNLPCQKAYARFLKADTDLAIRHSLRDQLNERRKCIVEELRVHVPDLTFRDPDGAFYLFPSVESLYGKIKPNGEAIQCNDEDVAKYFLEEGHLAFVPGSKFGRKGNIRVAYSRSIEQIKAGVFALAEAINKLR